MLEFRFEMNLGGSWVDVTSYVRQSNTVSIKRGKGDESVKLQPSTAKFVLENDDDRFNPRNPTGPYFGLLIRNTPVRIFAVVSGDDYPRFYGEVYGFEPRWNEDRSDCYVAIEAASVLRRILQNEVEPHSAYRQWVNNHSGNPVVKHYWPLEDGSDAVEGLPDIGPNAATFSTTPLKKSWGAGEMNDWFPNGVKIEDLNTLTFPADMRGSSASAWEMTALMNFPNDDTTLLYEINCSTQTWYIYVSSVTNNVMVVNPTGGADISPFTLGVLKDVGPVWMTFRVSLVSGTLTAYVSWDKVSKVSDAINVDVSASLSLPLEFPRYAKVSNGSNAVLSGLSGDVTINLSNLSFSECATGTSGMQNSYVQMKGAIKEPAPDRFERLSADQGIHADTLYYGGADVPMGRQFVQSYEDHLQEIQASAHGFVVEAKDSDELVLSWGSFWIDKVFGGAVAGGLSIAYSELVGSIEPTEDDQQTANQVTVKNTASGEAVVRKATGEMSIAQSGLFASKLDTNNYYHSDAVSMGYYRLGKGTNPAVRIPSVTVSGRANPTKYAGYLGLDVGEALRLRELAPAGYYDVLWFQVVGYEESFNQVDHLITFNLVPADVDNQWGQFGTTTSSLDITRIDMDDCTTSSLVNSTATTIDVETPTSRWTTTSGDWPFTVMIAGEQITVTAVSNVDSNTQRFTVTRSVNGVVKSLPASSKVELFPGNYLGVF
jgi:hypothetical protein